MTNEMEMIATGVVPVAGPEPEVPELLAESLDRLRKWATLDAVTDRPDMHQLMQDHHNDMDAILQAAGAQAEKMFASLLKGRGGWWKPECSPQFLLVELIKHIEKGDMIDVMNFAMMLWFRVEPENDSEWEQWRAEINTIAMAWAEQKLDEKDAFLNSVYEQTVADLKAETERRRAADLGIVEGQPLTITHVAQAREMLQEYVNSISRQLKKNLPQGARLVISYTPSQSEWGDTKVDIQLEVGP